jgi:hypothetical protein
MATAVKGQNYVEQVGGYNYWRGQRVLVCEQVEVQNVLNGLVGTVYPGWGGDFAPVYKNGRAIYDPPQYPGMALIEAYFETKRKPGKMTLKTSSRSKWRKVMKEPDGALGGSGRVIEGPDAKGNIYSVSAGENHVNGYVTILQIATAYQASSFDLSNALSLRGCVNNDPLGIAGFGTIQARGALLESVDTSKTYDDDIVDVDYVIAWSGPFENWNDSVKVQEGTYIVVNRNVYDQDEETGKFTDSGDDRKQPFSSTARKRRRSME